MTSLFFLLGLVAVVAGVAMVSTPAALIVGGLLTAAVAVAVHDGGDDGAA